MAKVTSGGGKKPTPPPTPKLAVTTNNPSMRNGADGSGMKLGATTPKTNNSAKSK